MFLETEISFHKRKEIGYGNCLMTSIVEHYAMS
jgi:hypothetical protein